MRALLLKDYYTITKEVWATLLFWIVIGYLTDNILVMAMMPGAFLMQAFINDEESKWGTFVNVLPISDYEVVLSRYIYGYIMGVVSLVLVLTVIYLPKIIALPFTPSVEDQVLVFIGLFVFAILLQSLMTPILFELSIAEARGLLILCTLGLLGLGMFFFPVFTQVITAELIWSNLHIIVIIAVASQIISIRRSVHVYRKRRFSEQKRIGKKKL